MEALRTVVSEVELCEVAAVESVGEAARKSLIAVRQRFLQVALVGLDLIAVLVDQQAAQGVFAEGAVVFHGGFDVGPVVDVFPAFVVVEVFGGVVVAVEQHERVVARGFVVRTYIIIIGVVIARNLEVGVARRVEQHPCLEPLYEEVEVLLQFELDVERRTAVILVSLDEFGVGVGVGRPAAGAAHRVAEEDVFGRRHQRRGIVGGEEYGIRFHDHLVGLLSALERSPVVVERSRHADDAFGAFREVDVDVRTHLIRFQVDVAVEVVAFVHFQVAVVHVERTGDVVAGHVAAAADVHVQPLVRGHLLHQHRVPVVGRVEIGIVAAGRAVDLFLRVFQRSQRIARARRFVGQFHEGDGVRQLDVLVVHREGVLEAERDAGSSDLSGLGRDLNYAVGASGAVEGRCGGVLEDRKGGDVVGLEPGEVRFGALDAVDQDQGVHLVSERSDAADKEVGAVGARLSAALIGDHSRHAAGEGGREVA